MFLLICKLVNTHQDLGIGSCQGHCSPPQAVAFSSGQLSKLAGSGSQCSSSDLPPGISWDKAWFYSSAKSPMWICSLLKGLSMPLALASRKVMDYTSQMEMHWEARVFIIFALLAKSQGCAPTAQKAKSLLGCIPAALPRRLRDWFSPSALMRPHLQSCAHLWGARRWEGPAGWINRNATKMLRGMEQLSFGDRLRGMGWPSLDKARQRPYFSLSVLKSLYRLIRKMESKFWKQPVVTGQRVMVLN